MIPLVTVITPTFNHARFIGPCLESVLGQTEPRWEQIVVDDGSTDGTPDMISRFTDPRIRYLRQEHQGIMRLGDAYNRALSMARGELVAVLEGDDAWPPDKLEEQLRAFRDPRVILSWGRAAEIDAGGNLLRLVPDTKVVQRMLGISRPETVLALLQGNPIPSCTVMCRTRSLIAIGGFQAAARDPERGLPDLA